MRRALVRIAVGLLVFTGLAGAGLWGWWASGAGPRWVRQQGMAALSQRLAWGELTVGSVDWHRWGVDVREVAVADGSSTPIRVDAIRVEVDPWSVLRGGLHVRSLEIGGVDLHTKRRADGTLDLQDLWVSDGRGGPWQGLGLDLWVERFTVSDLRFAMDDGPMGTVSSLNGTLVSLDTQLVGRADMAVALASPEPVPLQMAVAAALDPSGLRLLGLRMDAAVREASVVAWAEGPPTGLRVAARVHHDAGVASVEGVGDASAGTFRGSASTGAFDLGRAGALARPWVVHGKVEASWEAGRLAIHESVLGLPTGPASASGQLWPDGRAELAVEAALRRRGTASFGVPDVGADARFAGSVRRSASARVDVSGDLFWPSVSLGGFAAGPTHAAVDLRIRDGAVDGTAVVRLDDVVASGFVAGEPVVVRTAFVAGRDGWEASGRARLGRHRLVGLSSDAAELTFRADASTVVAAVRSGTSAPFLLDGALRWERPSGELVVERLMFAPSWRTAFVANGPVRAVVTDVGVRDLVAVLQAPVGRVSVHGNLGATGPLDATIRLDAFELDALTELWPEAVGDVYGRVDATLQLGGDAAAPTARLRVAMADFWRDRDVRGLGVRGVVDLRDGVASADLVLASPEADAALVRGTLPVRGGVDTLALDPSGEVDFVVDVLPTSWERVAQLFPSVGDVPAGRLSGRLRAKGVTGDPSLEATVVAEADVPGWTLPGRVEARWTRVPGLPASLWMDLRRGLQPLAQADLQAHERLDEAFAALFMGIAPADDMGWIDRVVGQVAVEGLELAPLLDLAGADLPLGGTLTGSVRVDGPPMAPRLTSQVAWRDATIASVPLSDASFGMVPRADGAYDVGLSGLFAEGGRFALTGRAPDPFAGGPIGLTLSATEVPLAVMEAFTDDLRVAGGALGLTGTLSGTLSAPRPEVEAFVEGGRLTWVPLGLAVDALDLRAELDEDSLRVARASARTAPARAATDADAGVGSRVTAAGAVRAAPEGARFGLTLGFDQAWVAGRPDLTLRVDGQAELSGAWPEVTMRGDLSVVSGRARLNEAGGAGASAVDHRVVVHRDEASLTPADADETAIRFDVDTALDLGRNLVVLVSMPFADEGGDLGAAVSTLDVSARLGGELAVRVQDGVPTLLGTVEVVGGQASLLRSRFDLGEGTLAWSGGAPWDPDLDLHASMAVADARVQMDVTGTPSAPRIDLHSDEESDPSMLLAMVLTGARPDALGSETGAAAAGALASALADRLLGRASGGSVTVDADGTVRVGVPVNRTLYVRSVFAPEAALGDNTLTLETEWSLGRRLVLQSGLGYPDSWTDLAWEIRF